MKSCRSCGRELSADKFVDRGDGTKKTICYRCRSRIARSGKPKRPWLRALRVDPEPYPLLRPIVLCDSCGSPHPVRKGYTLPPNYCSDACSETANKDRRTLRRSPLRTRARRYGLTLERFDEMWLSQGGRCRLCSVELTTARSNGAHIDHTEADGETFVRGILCGGCNVRLGYLEKAIALGWAVATGPIAAYIESGRKRLAA